MKFNIKNLGAIEGNLSHPIKIMKQVGEMMRGRMQNAFAEQSRGRFLWRERKVPNIMGIIDDLEKGPRVKDRRFNPRPALKDTGALERSFGAGQRNVEMPTKLRVEIGTPVEYAPTLNVGGTSEKKVTRQVKKNLSIYLKRMRKKKGGLSDQAKKLGWLFRKDSVKVDIPARPFAIITQVDMKDIVKTTKDKFQK
jgi:phage gpG-like protein